MLYLDYSGITLPLPKQETWRNLKMTLRDCKVIESNNLSEYMRTCEQISEIELNGKFLNSEVFVGIKSSKIQKFNIWIAEPGEILKV